MIKEKYDEIKEIVDKKMSNKIKMFLRKKIKKEKKEKS